MGRVDVSSNPLLGLPARTRHLRFPTLPGLHWHLARGSTEFKEGGFMNKLLADTALPFRADWAKRVGRALDGRTPFRGGGHSLLGYPLRLGRIYLEGQLECLAGASPHQGRGRIPLVTMLGRVHRANLRRPLRRPPRPNISNRVAGCQEGLALRSELRPIAFCMGRNPLELHRARATAAQRTANSMPQIFVGTPRVRFGAPGPGPQEGLVVRDKQKVPRRALEGHGQGQGFRPRNRLLVAEERDGLHAAQLPELAMRAPLDGRYRCSAAPPPRVVRVLPSRPVPEDRNPSLHPTVVQGPYPEGELLVRQGLIRKAGHCESLWGEPSEPHRGVALEARQGLGH
eukprot:9332589-Pyramimonas_sp.AAC.2